MLSAEQLRDNGFPCTSDDAGGGREGRWQLTGPAGDKEYPLFAIDCEMVSS
jgi:hypothetical protein